MEPISHLAVDEQPSFDGGGRHDNVWCMEIDMDIWGIYIESISAVVSRTEPTHLKRLVLINIYGQRIRLTLRLHMRGPFLPHYGRVGFQHRLKGPTENVSYPSRCIYQGAT